MFIYMSGNSIDSLSLLKRYLDNSEISKESTIPTFRGKEGI